MRAIHVANIPNARVYYILDGEEGGNDGAVVPPNQDPMFVNFWSFAERKRHLKPVTNTKFHKFFWDGHKGDEADRWNNMFFERLIKPDAEMLSSVPIVTKFPNIKKERNNARSNHASEFKSLTGAGHHEKALGRRGRGLGRGIGRVGRGAASVFDPKAWDGDGDGIVQERTPYERPAIPGINTNLPGVPHTRTKPADYPDDHRDPIGERPPAPQEKPDISRMRRFKPEGAVGEHPSLIPMPGRRAERMARRTEPSPRRQGLRSSMAMDPHGPMATDAEEAAARAVPGADPNTKKDPLGGLYPPPSPFDVWRRHPDRTDLIGAMARRIAAMRGPDHYEKWQKRVRARVDKRLNDGQPIETIADAKRVMGAVNSSFLPGPNGENPRSEASFLGVREIVPDGAGWKLGGVQFRGDDEVLDEHDRNFMYAWLANSIQSGRYDLTNWVLLSKTDVDRRSDYKVRDLNGQIYGASQTTAGMVGYMPGSRGAWRHEERGPVEGELAELMGDEDAPIFTASTVSQETLKESLGWLKPSGSGYVINEDRTKGEAAKEKPTLTLMYASEPTVVGDADPATDNPELVYKFTDTAGNVTHKKIYGIRDYKEPKEAMIKMESVALTHFASVMNLLEDDEYRTQEEIDTKGTDQAIAPTDAFDGRRHTKRFMRVYDRARTLMFDSVSQHELGHANHFLAMLEDFSKRAGALSGRKIDYKKLSEFMATEFHQSLSKKQKRRMIDFAAIRAIHETKGQWEDDIFKANTVLRALTIEAVQLRDANTPDLPLEQEIIDFTAQMTAVLALPILDHNGQPMKRGSAIRRLLQQHHSMMRSMAREIAFDYDPSDHPDQQILTRGDMFFLLGPSTHLPGNKKFESPLMVLESSQNKHGTTGSHEPWGLMMQGLFDLEVVYNSGFDPYTLHGAQLLKAKLSRQALERLHEIGIPAFQHRSSPSARVDAVDAETMHRLLVASGRIGGQVPARGDDDNDNMENIINVDPGDPVKLLSASDIDTETLLRTLAASHTSAALSDREVDDISKKIVEGTVERSSGTGQGHLRNTLKARQRLADGSVDQATAQELLRQVAERHEQEDWPLMLVIGNARLGTGSSILGDTNNATGQPWAIGDDIPLAVVEEIIRRRSIDAQDNLAQIFEAFGMLSEFYDALDETEIDILIDVARGFGGRRYTAYMGRRYPVHDGTAYAADGTRQEIMSELSALVYSGEKIMIQSDTIRLPDGSYAYVELSEAQQAVVDKLMKWMKPMERWGPDSA